MKLAALSVPNEHAEQVKVIQWFDKQYPKGNVRLFAVPNGGQRAKKTGRDLKAEGVRSGVPDLMLLTPRKEFYGLIIEMKRVKGGRLEPEQADWLQHFNAQGYMAVICKGGDAAIDTIKSYLGE